MDNHFESESSKRAKKYEQASEDLDSDDWEFMMNSSPEGEDLHPQKSEEDLEYEDRQREYEAAMEKKDDPFQFEDKFQAWLKSIGFIDLEVIDGHVVQFLPAEVRIHKVDLQGIIDVPFDDGGPGSYGDEPVPF